jgi:hypothetical protein
MSGPEFVSHKESAHSCADSLTQHESSAPPFWKRVIRHPIFPLLVYLALTQLIRDNYPFSHYPMYSKPRPGPIYVEFLADESGKPLRVLWHTGITASKVAKLHANRLKKFHDENAAAADVLVFLREANTRRPGRELPPCIRLVQSRLEFENGGVVETQKTLAENIAPL